jgi:hypothetical protein
MGHRITDVVDARLQQVEQPVPHHDEVGVAGDGSGGVPPFLAFKG